MQPKAACHSFFSPFSKSDSDGVDSLPDSGLKNIRGGYHFEGGCISVAGACKKTYRPDREPGHRQVFEANKRRLLATQDCCGICGQPIDKSLKYPHPMSATVDHIIPLAKGGNPSAIENLQLAHFSCNRQKSDKLTEAIIPETDVVTNRDLPLSRDWLLYGG